MARPRVVANDKVWRELRRKLISMSAQDAHVKVGILASQGGTEAHDPTSGLTLIEIAAVHEFGSPAAGVPERSFIRETARIYADELAKLQARVARGIINDTLTVDKALGILGAWLQTKIKRRITTGAGVPPPLAQATIDRKGSDRPLVDTGRLINAIQWEVFAGTGAG